MACRTCGITGHNRRTCKEATATATATVKAEPKAVAKAIPIVKVKGKTMKEEKEETTGIVFLVESI